MAKRSFVLVIVFVLFLAIGWFFSSFHHKKAVIPVATNAALDCSQWRIDQFQLKRREPRAEEFQFFRKLPTESSQQSEVALRLFSTWMMASPLAAEANQELLDALINKICSMPKLFAYEGSKSFASLGLESPTQEFQLASATKQFFLRLGSEQDEGKNFVIAAVAETPLGSPIKDWRLYWLPLRIQTSLRTPPQKEDFLNRNIVAMQTGNLQVLKLFVDQKERVTLERDGSSWNVSVGSKRLGEGNLEAEKFIHRVSKLLSVAWADYNYPAAKCTALPAKYRLELEGIAGRQESIRLTAAQSVDDGASQTKRLLACNSTRQTLWQVHADMEAYLLVSAKSLVDSKAKRP